MFLKKKNHIILSLPKKLISIFLAKFQNVSGTTITVKLRVMVKTLTLEIVQKLCSSFHGGTQLWGYVFKVQRQRSAENMTFWKVWT